MNRAYYSTHSSNQILILLEHQASETDPVPKLYREMMC